MLGFLSMSTGPDTDLKVLATGLGAGILIDAVVIRCLLVPAHGRPVRPGELVAARAAGPAAAGAGLDGGSAHGDPGRSRRAGWQRHQVTTHG